MLETGHVESLSGSEEKFDFFFTRDEQLVGAFGDVQQVMSNLGPERTMLATVGFFKNVCHGGSHPYRIAEIIATIVFAVMLTLCLCFLLYYCLKNRG